MNDKMEIGEIKKFDLSRLTIKSPSSPLVTRTMALKVGEAFEVKGKERADLSGALKHAKLAGYTISTKKLGVLHFAIVRTK